MKKLFLILSALLTLASSAWAHAPKKIFSSSLPPVLSSGQYSCAIDDEGVKCWWQQNRNFDISGIPSLINPRTVSVGERYACALDDDGVKCWNILNGYGPAQIPPLKNPRTVSAGGDHACALDDEGVKCWGDWYFNQHFSKVPALKNPKMVSVGVNHTCALDDNGVTCWNFLCYSGCDNGLPRIAYIPTLNNPKAISAGADCICALDNDGAKCWFYSEDELSDPHPYRFNDPALKNPKTITAGNRHACSMDDEGVKCWDGSNDIGNGRYQANLPRFKSPVAVNVGGEYSCALDDEGVRCWGGDARQPIVPIAGLSFSFATLANPRFNLDQLTSFLEVAQSVSDAARSKLFLNLKQFAMANFSAEEHGFESSMGRYLLLRLVSPAVLSSQTSYAMETLIPSFSESRKDFEKELGFDDVGHISHSPATNRVALKVLQSSFEVLSDFLNPREREQLQLAMRSIGQAFMDPMNENRIQAVVADIAAVTPVLDKVSANPKSAFLAQTVQMAADWLKGKL